MSFLCAMAVKKLRAVPHGMKECIGEFTSNS